MLSDQIDLLSAFNDQGVEYLVVGGHAVNAYTQARATKDLDVFVRGTSANGEAVFKALAQFGAPLAGISAEDFSQESDQFFQLGIEPNRVDILQRLSGVSFEEAWNASVQSSIDGVAVRFISREHLITNKLASGRPRDLGDVDELRKFYGKSI